MNWTSRAPTFRYRLRLPRRGGAPRPERRDGRGRRIAVMRGGAGLPPGAGTRDRGSPMFASHRTEA